MKNIFYIHRFPFNKEAFIRDEFEYFISKGYCVKYLDISKPFKKKDVNTPCPEELKQHVIFFDTKKEFSKFLSGHKKDTIIVSDVGYLSNSAWMFLEIFKNKIPYILFENAVLPRIKVKTAGHQVKVGFLKFLKRLNYQKIYQKPVELFYYYYALAIRQHAEMIITAKHKLSSGKKILLGPNTDLRFSVSLDYIRAKNIDNEDIVGEPYAVFVDQYFIHHPDFKTNHIVHFFTAQEYYGELNRFLSDFSSKTGLKVVIAAHPRRINEENNDFNPDFELYYNKTAQLVKHAQIALIHFSTAINFSVIFNKPFLLLNSNYFKNSSVGEEIKMFSDYFQSNAINMTDFLNENKDINAQYFDVDESKYQEFTDLYIKHPKANDETFIAQLESKIN